MNVQVEFTEVGSIEDLPQNTDFAEALVVDGRGHLHLCTWDNYNKWFRTSDNGIIDRVSRWTLVLKDNGWADILKSRPANEGAFAVVPSAYAQADIDLADHVKANG